MVKNYIATEADLDAVEEALSIIWKPELDFIFSNRKLIQATVVVSYDSKYIYLWYPSRDTPPLYSLRRISHSISIPSKFYQGWWAGMWPKLERLLPNRIANTSQFVVPRVSGGLLGLFISLQKKKKLDKNPYITRESYLATIVHEFGHIYWNQHKLWWYSDKKQNLRYLRQAHLLYSQQRSKNSKITFHLPSILAVGEIYAYCAEYAAGNLFWPVHCENHDKFIQRRLKGLLDIEAKRSLNQMDSVIAPDKFPHDFASVFGKIILTRYPKLWPELLTHRPIII